MASEQRLVNYRDGRGREPFAVWHLKLADRRAQGRILARLNRLRAGNFGLCDSVGRGVFELKIDYGPGYRVYFGRAGRSVVVLLCGGVKSSQVKDIETAKRHWELYKEAR